MRQTKALKSLSTRMDPPPPQVLFSLDHTKELIHNLELSRIALALQNEELLQAKSVLQETYDKYTALCDLASVSCFTLENHGVIVGVNKKGASLLGINKEVLLGQNFSRYLAPDSQLIFNSYWQLAMKEEKLHDCELKLLNRNGPILCVKIYGKIFIDLVSNKRKLVIIVTDVTHLKNNELNRFNDKQAYFDGNSSINMLASVVAQKLNHPLAVIQNYLNGCALRLKNGNYQASDFLQAITKASEQLHNISNIILRMKNFSCKNNLKFETTCINALIHEVISSMDYDFADFPVKINYKPLPSSYSSLVSLDRVHIQQVLLNLVRNSMEALRDNSIPDPKITIETTQLDLENIEISVLDNGPGFCPKIAHLLFNSQITTKPYGIGMGLTMCRAIIEAHAGKISAELRACGGSCFKFTLPLKE